MKYFDEIGEVKVLNNNDGFQIEKVLMNAGFVLRGKKIENNEISFVILKPMGKYTMRED